MNGARSIAAAGRPKARAAIIGEPTSLVPIRMHKGISMFSVKVTGQSGHSSNPMLGKNALDGMHKVMKEILDFSESDSSCRISKIQFSEKTRKTYEKHVKTCITWITV